MKYGLIALILVVNLSSCQNQQQSGDARTASDTLNGLALDTFILDPEQSLIYWIGSSPSAQHNGLLKISSGKIYFSEGSLVSAEVTADMNSITNLNLEKESERMDLEDHLKDSDFFSVDSFPEAYLKLLNVERESDSTANYIALAELNIKGIRKPVNMRCVVELSNNSALVGVQEFSFDRTDFGIMYQSKKILPNLIDGYIHDEIKMSVKLLARKK